MKIILNLIFSCLIFGVVANAQDNAKVITVDFSRNDKLNISQIAEDVKAIPLNFVHLNIPLVNQVIVTSDYLYVKVSEPKKGSHPFIYQLQRDGKLIRQVGLRDAKSNEFIDDYGMFYSEKTKELIISYKTYLAIFDENGKLKRKIDGITTVGYGALYNNKYYGIKYIFDGKNSKVTTRYTSTDLATNHLDTIFIDTRKFAKDEHVFPGFEFSTAENKLYYNDDSRKQINRIDNNKIECAYRFIYKDKKEVSGNIPDYNSMARDYNHMPRIVFNRYISFGYFNDRKDYCLIYDKKNGESFHVTPGINDDIFGTGHFILYHTNSENYAYSFKSGDLVSGKIKGVEDESTWVLFLTKLKQSN